MSVNLGEQKMKTLFYCVKKINVILCGLTICLFSMVSNASLTVINKDGELSTSLSIYRLNHGNQELLVKTLALDIEPGVSISLPYLITQPDFRIDHPEITIYTIEARYDKTSTVTLRVYNPKNCVVEVSEDEKVTFIKVPEKYQGACGLA
jgi:hypothetical protein